MPVNLDQVTGERGRNWVIATLGGLALTLVAFVAVVGILLWKDRDFNFSMDGTGELTVSAEGAPLSEVIEGAMAEHPEVVVAALRRLDARAEEHRALTNGIRTILWNTEGPFSGSGVLAGADNRLYEKGVVELVKTLDQFDEDDPNAAANAFITRIMVDQLKREGLFDDRHLRARAIRVDGVSHSKVGGRHVVYVCPDSKLENHKIVLMPNDPSVLGHGRAINAVAKVDRIVFDDCEEPPQTLGRYLARQPAHIAIAGDGFVRFANGKDTGGGQSPDEVAAKLWVLPKNFVGEPILPDTASQ